MTKQSDPDGWRDRGETECPNAPGVWSGAEGGCGGWRQGAVDAMPRRAGGIEYPAGISGREIRETESLLTSVRPTVTAINDILKGFGFNGFMLAVNEKSPGTYKIVRCNGEDASKTLSEGEHNFLSFLYFYHLCFGSQDSTNVTRNKVLVIDDPISSMDNNVLFIVRKKNEVSSITGYDSNQIKSRHHTKCYGRI